MKVLLVALEAPLPPINGLRLPLRALVPLLASRCDLRVVARRTAEQSGTVDLDADMEFVDDPSSTSLAAGFELARATLTGRPMRVDRTARLLRPAVQRAIADFSPDVVHVFSGRLGALHPDVAGCPTVLTALDAWHRNVEARADLTTGIRRWVLQREAGRVRGFERSDVVRFDRVVTVTDEDRDELGRVASTASIAVIPNGVDAEHFVPGPPEDRHAGRIVFHGVMDYPPNVLAARRLVHEILPRVRRDVDASVTLVGRSPSPEVVQMAGPHVEVTGEVADVRSWLRSAHVYVAAMSSGTGIKNKVLEAMATGLPVVGTSLAVQGLDVTPGVHALVSDEDQSIAGLVGDVLTNADLATRLGAAGRGHVVERYSWEAMADAYIRLYEDLLAEVAP